MPVRPLVESSSVVDLTQESPTGAGSSRVSPQRPSQRPPLGRAHTENNTHRAWGSRSSDPIVIPGFDSDDEESVLQLRPAGSTGLSNQHTRRNPSAMRIHDNLPRGPHGSGSRIPQSTGVLASSAVRHTGSHRRAAVPTSHDVDGYEHGFGRAFGMQLIGSFLQSLRSRHSEAYAFDGTSERPAPAAPKPPLTYDPQTTHPYEAQDHFVHSIIEPPVDLETYFEDKDKVTGPLPDTTPICAGCRCALVTGGANEYRLWALPCGHVIDGKCIDRLSGLTPVPPPPQNSHTEPSASSSKRKGKVKAVDPSEDEPLAKGARTSVRSRPPTTAIASDLPPKSPAKAKRFFCPVQGCGQKCSKEPGGKFAAWQIYE